MDQQPDAAGTAYLPITSGRASDPGKLRELNEDYVVAMQLGGGEGESCTLRYAAAIADGMGGHNAGEIASRTAVDTFLDSLHGVAWTPDNGSAEDAVVRAFRAADKAVLACGRSSPENEGMGTTLTGLVVVGNEANIAHVGDTRAYLVRNGSIRQLTRDDSWVADQVESGAMTEEEAGSSQHRNLLSRALGTKADLPIHTYREALAEGDFLVLTTDGLHNSLSAPEIGDVVRDSRDSQEACERLAQLARDRDGSDNISVLCLAFGQEARRATTRHLPRVVGKSRRRRKLRALLLLVVLAAAVLIAHCLRPTLLRPPPKGASSTGVLPANPTKEKSDGTDSEPFGALDPQSEAPRAADERITP